MNKLWRKCSKALSAILAAAMIITSVPTATMSTYAVEDTTEITGAVEEAALSATSEDEAAPVVEDEETTTPAEQTTTPADPEGDEATDPVEPSAPAEGTTDPAEPSEGTTDPAAPSEGTTEPADSEDGNTEPAAPSDENTDPADPDGETTDPTEDEETLPEDPAEGLTEEEIADTEDATDAATLEGEVTLEATSENDFGWNGNTITKYTGAGGDIVIPARATAIDENAFYKNKTVTSVSFAGSKVTSIGRMAFYGCTGLTSVELPNGLNEIGYEAFYGCTGLTTIEFPSSLRTMANYVFGKTNIESVYIPATLTKYSSAFDDCTALRSVEFGEGTTQIGRLGGNKVTSITLPSTLKTIGENAFKGCTQLSEIDLPDGLQTIGRMAFYGCTGLTSIELPSSLNEIYYEAFYGCTGLTAIEFPSGLRLLESYVFANTNIESVYIPSTLTSYSNAFADCTALRSVEFGEGTTQIGRLGGNKVTSITLPSTLKTIGENAFKDCTQFSEIDLPDGLQTIGRMAFYGCTGLTSIELPSSLNEIYFEAFYGCTGLTAIELPSSLRSLESYVFGKTNIESVYVPSTLTSYTNAFADCTALRSVEFGEGTTQIGRLGGSKVTSITLPSTLKTIGANAFKDCTQFSEIDLPDGLQTIDRMAFYGCTDLTKVHMPASLQSIGYNAFYNCAGLTELRFDGDGNVTIDKYAFDASKNTQTVAVYCVAGSKVYNYFNGKSGFEIRAIYSIKYELNGGTNAEGNPASYENGESLSIADPTKQGYTFGGWYTDKKFTKPFVYDISSTKGNLTLYARWEGSAYKLVYDKNGKDATGTMESIVLSSTAEYTILAEGYTRAGYDFLGWNTAANGKGKAYYEGDVVKGLSTKDGATVTLYAQWQKSICEINYELDGGTNAAKNPDSYSVGQTVKLQNPTKTGYTFAGWYTDAEHTEKVTQITSALGDVTVYALWSENIYTIVYNGNKGTGSMASVTTGYDHSETLPANEFYRAGYTFTGWNTAANGKGKAYEAGEAVSQLASKNNAKVTLYAQWQVDEVTIHYELDGGTNSTKNPSYVTIVKDVSLSAPTKTGYTFKGWYTDAARTQALAGNKISRNTTTEITVYAKWEVNSYTLKFDKNGGTVTVPAVAQHTYAEYVTMPGKDGASRTNYELTGWNTKKDGTGTTYGLGATVSGLAAKGTVTLYAVWTPVADKTYRITYTNITGWDNSKNPSTYSFDKDVKLANPTKTGYTFKGWYLNNASGKKVSTISKKQTGAVTLYGVWSENSYKITYNANKGAGKMVAQTVSYTQSTTLTKNDFTRKGYTFTGWNTKADGTGTAYTNRQSVKSIADKGTVILYAQWEIIPYDITYVNVSAADNSENTATYTIAKDVALKNPSMYGYTFKGWYTDAAFTKKITKIAKATCSDVTVYAQWSENRYNLRFSTGELISSVKSVTNKNYTDTFTIPSTVPTKEGYTFKGWALTKNGTVLYRPGQTISMESLHNAGATAKGLVGTKYFTLYAIFQ